MPLWGWVAAAVVGTLLYVTLAEYLIHRLLDHRRPTIFGWRPKLFEHLYQSHSMAHHADYSGGESYVYEGKCAPMDFVDVPLLFYSHVLVLPLYIAGWFLGGWVPAAAAAGYVMFHYVFLYSAIHYFMHHPKSRRWGKMVFVRNLNFHHWLHHRHQNRNFAFTYPIFDYVLGTKARGTVEDREEFARLLDRIAVPIPPRMPAAGERVS